MIGKLKIVPTFDVGAVRTAIRVNSGRGLPHVPFHVKQGGLLSICGNAPSLREIYPTSGPIVACNGAWRTLVKNGVMPDIIVASDPIKENIAWFVDAPKEPVYYLASRMDPAIFDVLKDHKVFIWHLMDDTELETYTPDQTVSGGVTIPLKAMNLFASVGYNNFNLYGVDSCYGMDGTHHASPQEWKIDDKPQPVQIGDKLYIAEGWMIGQLQECIEQIQQNRFNYLVNVISPGLLKHGLDMASLDLVYDLDRCPPNYSFREWIQNAENYRHQHGYARIRVRFSQGSEEGFRPHEPVYMPTEYKRQMVEMVCRPLIRMYGAEEGGDGKNGSMLSYVLKPAVDYYKETGYLAVFGTLPDAVKWAEQYEGCYTITLRESSHWKGRNSNIDAWIKFAKTLDAPVIFVRDTEKANKRADIFHVCELASRDIYKRLALYRSAHMNFFVNNGPAMLATCTKDIPYIVFHKHDPEYPVGHKGIVQNFLGFEHGEQYPWATENQLVVWQDDTFENITRAWAGMKLQKAA